MSKFRDTIIWLVIGFGCFIYTYYTSNGDLSTFNTKYNLLFLLVMFIIYGISLFSSFYTISRLNLYFEATNGILKGYKLGDNVRVIDKIQSIKGYRPIDKRIDGFLKDLGGSQSGIVDIQDYINDDETDTICKKWVLDVMPDIFTSLGILGTFVGIVWGLKNFNTADFDTMTASVAALIDGIKVAFLTSIYGMINSLGFMICSSSGYSALQGNLQKFLDLFHSNVLPNAEVEAQNIMVKTQQNQETALRTMSDGFVDKMANDSIAQEVQRINSTVEDLGSTFETANMRMAEEIVSALEQVKMSSEATQDAITSMSDISQRNIETAEEQGELLRQLLEANKEMVSKLDDLINK